MGNPFCHVELNSTDLPKSKKFYSKLFDWKLQDVPNSAVGTYTFIDVGGKDDTGGGMMKVPMEGCPSFWLSYVLVKDIETSTKKAKKLGANIVRDVTEVMGMGWLSIIEDPQGAHLGLWQPAKKRKK